MPPLSAWTTSIPALVGASRRSFHSSSVKSAFPVILVSSRSVSLSGRRFARTGRACARPQRGSRPCLLVALPLVAAAAAARAAAGIDDHQNNGDRDGEQ